MVKMVLNMTVSVDGFIANESGDSSFALQAQKIDPNFKTFYDSVDSIVMGRRTYDFLKVSEPEMLAEKHIFVITHYLRQQEGNIVFIHEDIMNHMRALKDSAAKNVWVMGGAEIANILIKEQLIDEMTLTTAPLLVGMGIRLFKDDNPKVALKLQESTSFDGYVQNKYVF